MKLFLFAPSKKWSYCGGATLICAETLDEAIALGNDAGDAISQGGLFFSSETQVTVDESWVWVDTFALDEQRPRGVLFSNANYV